MRTFVILIFLILATLSLSAKVFPGFSDLSDTELYQYKSKASQKKSQAVSSGPHSKQNEMILLAKEILKQDRESAAILAAQAKTLNIRKKDDKIPALTRIHGVLLNSVGSYASKG